MVCRGKSALRFGRRSLPPMPSQLKRQPNGEPYGIYLNRGKQMPGG